MNDYDSNDVHWNTEDKAMMEYIRLGYVETKHDREALHMFFSPQRISMGLDRRQVRLCIQLYPLRKMQKQSWEEKHQPWVSQEDLVRYTIMARLALQGLREGRIVENVAELSEEMMKDIPPQPDIMIQMPVYPPVALPMELLEPEPITPFAFEIGIRKFVDQAMEEIKEKGK